MRWCAATSMTWCCHARLVPVAQGAGQVESAFMCLCSSLRRIACVFGVGNGAQAANGSNGLGACLCVGGAAMGCVVWRTVSIALNKTAPTARAYRMRRHLCTCAEETETHDAPRGRVRAQRFGAHIPTSSAQCPPSPTLYVLPPQHWAAWLALLRPHNTCACRQIEIKQPKEPARSLPVATLAPSPRYPAAPSDENKAPAEVSCDQGAAHPSPFPRPCVLQTPHPAGCSSTAARG